MIGKVGKAKGSIISARIMPILEYPFFIFYIPSFILREHSITLRTCDLQLYQEVWSYFPISLQCIKITMQSVVYSVLVSSIISICINSRYISTWLFGSVQLHVLLTPGIPRSLHYTQIQQIVIWDKKLLRGGDILTDSWKIKCLYRF